MSIQIFKPSHNPLTHHYPLTLPLPLLPMTPTTPWSLTPILPYFGHLDQAYTLLSKLTTQTHSLTTNTQNAVFNDIKRRTTGHINMGTMMTEYGMRVMELFRVQFWFIESVEDYQGAIQLIESINDMNVQFGQIVAIIDNSDSNENAYLCPRGPLSNSSLTKISKEYNTLTQWLASKGLLCNLESFWNIDIIHLKDLSYVKTLVVNITSKQYLCTKNDDDYFDLQIKVDTVLSSKILEDYSQVMINIWQMWTNIHFSGFGYDYKDGADAFELIQDLVGDRKLIITNDRGDQKFWENTVQRSYKKWPTSYTTEEKRKCKIEGIRHVVHSIMKYFPKNHIKVFVTVEAELAHFKYIETNEQNSPRALCKCVTSEVGSEEVRVQWYSYIAELVGLHNGFKDLTEVSMEQNSKIQIWHDIESRKYAAKVTVVTNHIVDHWKLLIPHSEGKSNIVGHSLKITELRLEPLLVSIDISPHPDFPDYVDYSHPSNGTLNNPNNQFSWSGIFKIWPLTKISWIDMTKQAKVDITED